MGYLINKTGLAGLLCAVAPLLAVSTVLAAEAGGDGTEAVLKEVRVRETAPPGLIPPPDVRPNTQTDVSRDGIRALAGPAQTSPWKALQLAPSVNYQSADSYGLGNRMSFRIRGKSSSHVGRTVNGLPIAGEPGFASGKGGGDLFDLENLSSIVLMRGAVPAGSGLGFSNSSVVDLTLRGPERKFGIEASQSGGSDGFRRTFARLDSGQLAAAPVSFFLSASDTAADKWRGPGGQDRSNIEFGLQANLGKRVTIELSGVHHEVSWDDFRALSSAQAQDLGRYGTLDYNASLTGNPTTDASYHRFNRQDYTNDAYLGRATFLVDDDSRLTLKPYYWKESGYSLAGSTNVLGSPGVTWWEIVHDTYGFDLRYDSKYAWGDLAVGYWFQSSEAPPPPTAQRVYRITAAGNLVFARWSTLAKTTRHRYDNPYVSATFRFEDTEVSAGLRYMGYKDPSFTYYLGNTAPDMPYGSVFGYNPQPDPAMFSHGRSFHEWLPNLGITHEWSSTTLLRASYGRAYGRQNWGSIASAYTGNRAAFDAAGIRFDEVWSNLRPEISDNFDLGARFAFGSAYVAPTLFHIRYENKQLNLFDPAVGVAYHQSVARASASGLELEVGAMPSNDLDIYFSYAYNRAAYDDDAATASNAVVRVDGKQMQDSPRHSAKIGAVWRVGAWSVAPVLRYIGKRFGDTEELEPVSAHAVADLNIDYELKDVLGLERLGASLAVSNLFDKRYIGIINASDYAVGGLPTYLPGAPRSVALTVSAKF